MNNSKNIYIWLTIVIAFILSSCMQKEDYEGQLGNSGNIILNFSVNNNILTKAQDLSFESKITHADVFIFNPDGTSRIHYERMTIDGTTGTKVLGKKLTDLTIGNVYKLYVIANSTATTETLGTKTTVAALESMVETTTYINITGSTIFTDNNGQAIAPQTFLMTYDGTLQNDGTKSELELNIELDRAAAKLTFNFKIKENSTNIHSFGNPIDATVDQNNQITLSTIDTINYTHASYYLRNMPYTTLYYGTNSNYSIRITNPIPFTDGGYMTATPDTIAVTVYVYSCSWGANNDDAFAATPFLIVNLPIVEIIGNEGKGIYQERNYYEIPLRIRAQNDDGISIGRNNHYVINATIDAPGGLTSMEPFPIVPVSYYVYPWNDKSINVGGSKEDVKYLNLSTNYIEMHNTTSDNSLKFASSSDITVSLQSAYYIDKNGNQIDVKNSISSSVTAVATSGMNGNITINAPLPENDAVRYMTFKATNGTAQHDKTFTVVQYPLLYIFNTVGWYSYREDMKHKTTNEICHYQNKQTSGNVTKNPDDGFNFRVYDKPSILFWQGNYGIYVYADAGVAIFSRDGWRHQFAGGLAGGNVTYDLDNPRMYHINIAATSKDYVLGKPLLDDDKTCKNTPENAKMVSPSFMIASQLGTLNGADTYNTDYYNKAKNHCLNYVETYILNDDGDNEFEENRGEKVIHLDDWRLPTKEEINIIVQNQTGDAMDNLLIGQYYICITGDKNAPYTQAQASTERTGYYTRCVRDAYDDKTPKH